MTRGNGAATPATERRDDEDTQEQVLGRQLAKKQENKDLLFESAVDFVFCSIFGFFSVGDYKGWITGS